MISCLISFVCGMILACDLWLRWFLPIFACRGGPGSAARCGGGPRGTQKLIRIFCFCSPEPFTKIFLKRKPRENLAKTLRKPCENLAKTLRKLRENLAKASRKPRESLAKASGKTHAIFMNIGMDPIRRVICLVAKSEYPWGLTPLSLEGESGSGGL